jgi:hypothetical protein
MERNNVHCHVPSLYTDYCVQSKLASLEMPDEMAARPVSPRTIDLIDAVVAGLIDSY